MGDPKKQHGADIKTFLEGIAPIWKPHPGQREFLESRARIKVLACGRRWGKTDACAVSILAALFQPSPTRHIILAPTLDQARLLFDRVADLLDDVLEGSGLSFSARGRRRRKTLTFCDEDVAAFGMAHVSDLDKWDSPEGVRFAKNKAAENGKKVSQTPFPKLTFGAHTVVARSGHLGRSLRGNEASHIVVDEAAYVPEELITEVAMPMLATTNGYLTLISTPRGMNHFWRFFKMGEARGDAPQLLSQSLPESEALRGLVWSRRAPSSENPMIPASFLQVQKELISERAFRVEYEAEFIEEAGAVFSSQAVEACVVPELPEPPREPYCVGIDWARVSDYSAVAVVCGSRERAMLVEMARFTGIRWEEQLRRIALMLEAYPSARVCCDATGSGDPLVETLQGRMPHMRVDGLPFTAPSKAALIDNLAWFFERQALRMRPVPELLRELQHFSSSVSDSGNRKFGALSGFHDDLVIALALAVRGLPAGLGVMPVATGKRRFG